MWLVHKTWQIWIFYKVFNGKVFCTVWVRILSQEVKILIYEIGRNRWYVWRSSCMYHILLSSNYWCDTFKTQVANPDCNSYLCNTLRCLLNAKVYGVVFDWSGWHQITSRKGKIAETTVYTCAFLSAQISICTAQRGQFPGCTTKQMGYKEVNKTYKMYWTCESKFPLCQCKVHWHQYTNYFN